MNDVSTADQNEKPEQDAPNVANEENYTLINVYQEVTERHVKSVIDNANVCKCKKCFMDACAIMLNQLPPSYVTTHKGALLAGIGGISAERNTEMMVMAAKAVKMVSESPHHN